MSSVNNEQLSFSLDLNNNIFKNEPFMGSIEKEKALKNFRLLLKNNSIDNLNNILYTHLYCHVGFIAHYNIHGFKQNYSGPLGFKLFINELLSYKESCTWDGSVGTDLSKIIMDLASKNHKRILSFYKMKEHETEEELLKSLASRLGYKLIKS